MEEAVEKSRLEAAGKNKVDEIDFEEIVATGDDGWL